MLLIMQNLFPKSREISFYFWKMYSLYYIEHVRFCSQSYISKCSCMFQISSSVQRLLCHDTLFLVRRCQAIEHVYVCNWKKDIHIDSWWIFSKFFIYPKHWHNQWLIHYFCWKYHVWLNFVNMSHSVNARTNLAWCIPFTTMKARMFTLFNTFMTCIFPSQVHVILVPDII